MQKIQNLRKWVARIAIGLAIFIPLYFALATLGAKFGLWDFRFGFKLLTGYGPKLLIISAIIAAIALIMSLTVKPRKVVFVSMIALAVPLSTMAYGKSIRAKARSVPPIHDITTDTQDPPVFSSTIIDLRGEKSNPLNYIGKTIGETEKIVSVEQEKAYPDIRTIETSEPVDASFEKALSVVSSIGWKLQSNSQSKGIIEATDTTTWFGFKDDVVIRIRPSEAGGSIIDIRSVSRVGMSDVGANAARIRKFIRKFKE